MGGAGRGDARVTATALACRPEPVDVETVEEGSVSKRLEQGRSKHPF